MLHCTITLTGRNDSALADACAEVRRLLSVGYTSGHNSNDDSSFSFDVTGTEEACASGDSNHEPAVLDQYGEPVPDLGAIPSIDTLDEGQAAQVFAAPWYSLGESAQLFVPLDILIALGIEDSTTPQETGLNQYQPQRVAEALKRANYVDGFYCA